MGDDKVDLPVVWSGAVRVEPAAVFVVGGEQATAAELARWVRRMRAIETQAALAGAGAGWADAVGVALMCSTLVSVVWLLRR